MRVKGNLQSNSSEAIRQAVIEGIGICYTPLWVYGDDIRAGRVKLILTRYRATPLPLNVVFQPARRPSIKISHFVSFFAEEFARDPDISPMLAADGAPHDEFGKLGGGYVRNGEKA